MPFTDLKTGDVIIEISADNKASHSLMWASGTSPLIHATQGKGFGVQQHSSQYLGRKAYKGTKLRVYRHRGDDNLAQEAAAFAEFWATDTTVKSSQDSVSLSEQKTYQVLKTPYSSARLKKAMDGGTREWKVESLFRVVKAIANRNANIGLSPQNGVTCSQFITYCFQAAALKQYVGEIIRPEFKLQYKEKSSAAAAERLEKWNAKHGTGNEHYWRQKQLLAQENVFAGSTHQGDLISAALGEHAVPAGERIPEPLRVDAKTQTVENLKKALDHSGCFSFVGFVVMKCPSCGRTYEKGKMLKVIGGIGQCDCSTALAQNDNYVGALVVWKEQLII